MSRLNNARFQTFGAFVAVHDIEIVDAKQKIWRGKILIDTSARDKMEMKEVYFSRNYKPDVNELDQIYVEIHFSNESILGVEFWLIPKEKLLFLYQPPTENIILPTTEQTIKFQSAKRRKDLN